MSLDATDDAAGVPWAAGWARTDPIDLALPIAPQTPDDCPGVDACKPAGDVRRQTATLRQTVASLIESHGQLAAQVQTVGEQARLQQELIGEIATVVKAMQTDLRAVSDLLATGRVLSKGAGVLGSLAKPAGVIVLSLAALSAAASDWAVGVWNGLARAARIITGGQP